MTAEKPRNQRLHRLGQLYVRSPIFFVTACTDRRQNILATESVHQRFREFGEQKLDLPRRFAPFENGTPTHDRLGAKAVHMLSASWRSDAPVRP